MTELVANSPIPGSLVPLCTLAAPIASTGATSITTSAAVPSTGPASALHAAGQFRIIVWDGVHGEIMLVTAGQTGTGWTVTRGSSLASPDTCTSYTFGIGAQIFHDLTAGGLQALISGGSGASGLGLNAVTGGYLTPGLSSHQDTGLANAIAASVAAGEALIIPAGVYKFASPAAAFNVSANVHIKGETGGGAYSSLSGTVLWFDTDTTNAPETTAALTLGHSTFLHKIEDVALKGPGVYSNAGGVRPAAMAGINLLTRGRLKNVTIQGFGAAVLLGGTGVNADHLYVDGLNASDVGFGFFLNTSTGYGDQHFTNLEITANLAAFAAVADSAGFIGGDIEGGLYAPIGVMRWDDGTSSGGTLLSGMRMFCNIEAPAHAAIFDETYSSYGANASEVSYNNWLGGLQNPAGSGGWTTSVTCSVSGTTATLTGVPAGFVLRKGMVFVGGGTFTITAITVGAWPGTAYTVTLSGSPTGSPTTATISWPTLATIVAGAVKEENYGNAISSEVGYVAPFILAPIAVHDNKAHDGSKLTAYIAAGQPIVHSQSGQVFSSGQVWANDWGIDTPGSLLATSMQPATGATWSANDLVEQVTTAAGGIKVQQAQGTGAKIVGVAQQAHSSGFAPVDIVRNSDGSGTGTTVNNKTGSIINAGTLLKADSTNHGGVVAANLGDVTVGRALANLPATGSGAAQLWCGGDGVASGPSPSGSIPATVFEADSGTAQQTTQSGLVDKGVRQYNQGSGKDEYVTFMNAPASPAVGDLNYVSGVSPETLARLAIGSGTQFLGVSGGLPAWATPPGFANPMTTAGDVIAGGASGVPSRLAKGADGTFLGVSSGTLGYYTPGGASATRQQALLTALGLISEPFRVEVVNSNSVLVSQTIYCALLGLLNGDVVTNLIVYVSTAGVGTAPTLIRLGLANKAGSILAVTADVHASSAWTSTGFAVVPLSSPYTITSSDGYFACIIENGAFVTTPMQLAGAGGTSTLAGAAIGSGTPAYEWQTGQTDLPAVSSSMTLGSGGTHVPWVGVS